MNDKRQEIAFRGPANRLAIAALFPAAIGLAGLSAPAGYGASLPPCVPPHAPLPACRELRLTPAQKQCFINQSRYYGTLIAHYHALGICRSTSFRISPMTGQHVLYCDARPVAEIPNWYFKDYSSLCR